VKYSVLVIVLVVANLVLVLASWLLSATMTEDVRSLISSEGVRWFFSSFSTMLATPWLVWLLLLSMTGGCLWQSGLLTTLRLPYASLHYRQRLGFRTAVAILILYVAIVVALTAVPHAVLLSATGQLFPSPFSRALIPIISFGVLIISAVYGRVSGRYAAVDDILHSLSFGITKAAPLFILYILLIQFYESLKFVFF